MKRYALSHRLLILLLALCALSCQSITGYTPLCEADEDCLLHQRCDVVTEACVLRESYPTCAPDETFASCPVATSCDATAKACLPRPFRVAWVFNFESADLARRKRANFIQYITRYIAESYFQGISCIPSEETCQPGQIEFDFVTLDDTDPDIEQSLGTAYRERPFDLAIPISSISYQALKQLNASFQDGPLFLIMGRLNRLQSVVEEESAPNYTYPPLRTRFDFSSIPLQQTLALAHTLANTYTCQKPLILHADNPAYALTSALLKRDLAKYGVCTNTLGLSVNTQDNFPDVIEAIEEEQHDCIYTQFIEENLLSLLSDYVASSNAPEDVTWFMEVSTYTTPQTSFRPIQELIRESLADQVIFYEGLNTSNALFDAIYAQQFLPDYRAFLARESCLQEPISCNALACDTPPSEEIREACEALDCQDNTLFPSPPSCFDLMCQISSPPRYCEALECSSAQLTNCDYHTINNLDGLKADIALHMDLATTAHLMGYIHQQRSADQRPMALPALRDVLLDFYEANNEVSICGYPDLDGCKTLIEQGRRLNYSGLHSSGPFGEDARLIARDKNPATYYRLNESRRLQNTLTSSPDDPAIRDDQLEEPARCP